MKKIIWVVVIAMAIAFIGVSWPREYEGEIEAVRFNLEDKEYEQELTVKFVGYKKFRLFNGNLFTGKIIIGDNEYDLVELETGTTLSFMGRDTDIMDFVTIGSVVMNNSMTSITINEYIDGSWSSKDGFVISGPAANRDEAVLVSQELYSNCDEEMFNSMDVG